MVRLTRVGVGVIMRVGVGVRIRGGEVAIEVGISVVTL